MTPVMTIHKLSAGDGYTYLTKHVAAADATETTKSKINDYYNAKGTPPGKWHGALAECAGVEAGSEVTEAQMIATFGGAWMPNRAELRAQLKAQGIDEFEISRRTALGRAFPRFEGSGALLELVEQRCQEYKREHGEYPPADVTLGFKRELGREILRQNKPERADLVTDADVDKFVAASYAKARQPVAGYDLVFTPMKSVSVLWGLGAPEVKAAIEDAHRKVVDETLKYIEDQVAYTRRGAAGVRQVKADGLLIARFDHWDNRAGDPNLHTHCAVVNRVHAEGSWTSIDGRLFYQAAVSASEMYNTKIADEVSRSLGVTFAPRADTPAGKQPVYEIEGVPLGLIEEFSRRQAIETRQAELAAEYKELHGKNPPKKVQYAHAQQATLDTRNHKNPPRSMAEMRREWSERAAAVLATDGVSESIEALTALGRLGDSRPRYQSQMFEEIAARIEDDLSRKAGTWTGYTIRAEVQRALREYQFESSEHLDSEADLIATSVRDHLCRPVFVELHCAPELLAERESAMHMRLHTKDKSALKYTSAKVLEAEAFMRRIADFASTLTVDAQTIETKIAAAEESAGHRLGDDQRAMISHFLTAQKTVAVAVGAAGAGKTTAAAVIARSWETTGASVIALGPSARAAEVLGEELEVEGRTIADVLTRARHGVSTGIAAGDLLLVDEAGMASARDLADLTQIALDHGAVVRLLGDHQQLASVESGGVLRDLAERTDAPFLREVHRFKNPEEAEITLSLRDGDADVLAWYEDNNRIKQAMKHELVDEVFADYVADIAADKVALMVAPTNELVRQLNEKAAMFYRDNGTVSGREVELADGLRAAVGDVVVTRKNTSKFAVTMTGKGRAGRIKNGDLWTVTAVGADGSLMLENRTSGGTVSLPTDYVQASVQLGYASTVHRSQGMTVQRCRVLADTSMNRQSLYVALTRGKEANVVYAAADELPDWDFEHRPTEHPGAMAVLASIIERDGSQKTALAQIEEAAAAERSMPEQIATYAPAVTRLYEQKAQAMLAETLTAQQLAAVTGTDGWTGFVEEFARCDSHRLDTRALLDAAVAELRAVGRAKGFDDEDKTPAKVLAAGLETARKAEKLRPRTDELRLLGVPALPSNGDGMDADAYAFVAQLAQRMSGEVHAAAAAAEARPATWVAAIGDPGRDPRRAAMRHQLITRIVAHRLAKGIDLDAPEPLRGLKKDGVLAGMIEAIGSGEQYRKVYAQMDARDLAAARAAAKARISDTRHLLSLAEEELARLTERPTASSAQEQRTENMRQAQQIADVRASRERLDALRRSPLAGADRIAQATAEVDRLTAAAPPESMWRAIEFAARHQQESIERVTRDSATDAASIETTSSTVERLGRVLRQDEATLAAIDAERALRRNGARPRPRTAPASREDRSQRHGAALPEPDVRRGAGHETDL